MFDVINIYVLVLLHKQNVNYVFHDMYMTEKRLG
jgi:hypothetical protein